jgi:hypothetical protein
MHIDKVYGPLWKTGRAEHVFPGEQIRACSKCILCFWLSCERTNIRTIIIKGRSCRGTKRTRTALSLNTPRNRGSVLCHAELLLRELKSSQDFADPSPDSFAAQVGSSFSHMRVRVGAAVAKAAAARFMPDSVILFLCWSSLVLFNKLLIIQKKKEIGVSMVTATNTVTVTVTVTAY